MMRRPPALVVVALNLTLTACSGFTPTAPATSPQAPASGAGSAVAASTPTPTTPSATPLGPPVETKELAVAGGKVTMTLYPIRRDGNLMWLTARATFSNGDRMGQNLWSSTPLDTFPTGWRVVDQAGKRAYLPARSADLPMCGPRVPPMYPGDELIITCGFGAVPTSVTTVTVQSASFGEYANVPVR